MSELEPGSIPWSEVLRGATWFHTTGITPALGPGPAECTRAALATARELGATTSLDLNYRRKLWTESDAQRIMPSLVRHVDLLIGNEEDLQTALGLSMPRIDVTSARLDPEVYRAGAERVVAEHGVRKVAITLRESLSASENGWSAVLYDGATKTLHRGPRYMLKVVDRIGGGDSFAAGLVFGLLDGRSAGDALRFAIAAGALKHTIAGDFNRVSIEEVERVVRGDESGRVSR
jgi:2-dehydro-3-deoxygluconokinase